MKFSGTFLSLFIVCTLSYKNVPVHKKNKNRTHAVDWVMFSEDHHFTFHADHQRLSQFEAVCLIFLLTTLITIICISNFSRLGWLRVSRSRPRSPNTFWSTPITIHWNVTWRTFQSPSQRKRQSGSRRKQNRKEKLLLWMENPPDCEAAAIFCPQSILNVPPEETREKK